MSDSGDDLGGFVTETPHFKPKRGPLNGKPNNRNNAEAGPSSKPVRRPVARKKAKLRIDNSDEAMEVTREAEEVQEVKVDEEDSDDTQMGDVSKSRKTTLTATASTTNGKPAGKAKAKAKGPPPKSKETLPEPAAIDVDAIDERDVLDDELNEVARGTARTLATDFVPGKKEKTSSREVVKLQERLRLSHEHVRTLMEKVEETQRIRVTEAEKMLKAMDEQCKAELKAKEALVEALTSQLAQKETLALHGKHSILHMITREAADQEQRTLTRDIIQLKELLAQKDEELKVKDTRITELQLLEKELKMELEAEIDRSKAMALRNPQAAIRGRPSGAFEDPKNAKVIRFYEDLTNLLVTSMKHEVGQRAGSDEWTLKCIYTYSEDDTTSDAVQKSVAFTLRTTSSAKPNSDTDSNDQTIYYAPEDLDKEHPDFVRKLEFLNQPFSFNRRQLSLFVRTLYDKLKEACENDQEEDEVQIIE